MGKGLGGGTLHFGLQYVDQDDIINNNYSSWQSYFTDVSNIIGADKYNYSTDGTNYLPNQTWYDLENSLQNNKNQNTNIYNNKIYASNITQTYSSISSGKRLLLGDLINDLSNVEIIYNQKIKNIKYHDDDINKGDYINTFDNKHYLSLIHI